MLINSRLAPASGRRLPESVALECVGVMGTSGWIVLCHAMQHMSAVRAPFHAPHPLNTQSPLCPDREHWPNFPVRHFLPHSSWPRKPKAVHFINNLDTITSRLPIATPCFAPPPFKSWKDTPCFALLTRLPPRCAQCQG